MRRFLWIASIFVFSSHLAAAQVSGLAAGAQFDLSQKGEAVETLIYQEKYKEAMEKIVATIAIFPSNPYGYYLLALVQYNMGVLAGPNGQALFDNASYSINQALSIEPDGGFANPMQLELLISKINQHEPGPQK
jgi:hypothetical protein